MENTTVCYVKPQAVTLGAPKIKGIRSVGKVELSITGGDFEVFHLAGITAGSKIITVENENVQLGEWYKQCPPPSGTRFAEHRSGRVPRAKAKSVQSRKAAELAPKQEVIVDACEEYREAVAKRDVFVAAEPAAAIEKLAGVQMFIPFSKNTKVLAGAKAKFGLKAGFGKRRNAASLEVSQPAMVKLKEMYERGKVPGAANKSAATTLEELQGFTIKREWVDRVALTETVIKKKYSEWSKADKASDAKMRKEKKDAGEKGQGSEETGEQKSGGNEEQKSGEIGDEEAEKDEQGSGETEDEKAEKEEQELLLISSLEKERQTVLAVEITREYDAECVESNLSDV